MRISRLVASTLCCTSCVSLSLPAAAQQPAPDTSANCTANTVVFFGNGILTQYGSAVASLAAIEMALETRLTESERTNTTYELAYNQTDGTVNDLWEATKQRFSLDRIRLKQFLLAIAGYAELPDDIRDYLTNAIAERSAAERISSADVGKHVALYRNAIGSGKKVVVVAHSQGNFFVNLAYGSLNANEKRSFAIVSVANPDIAVADGGPYTTLANDLVIIGITAASSRAGKLVLPPNTVNALIPGLSNTFGHGFSTAYMRDSSSSYNRIMGHLVDRYRAIPVPSQLFGQGAIRATLTWGAQPDVDLHVFEPNGFHVYYSAKTGPSGYLDLDDTSSFGPENYFVGCPAVQQGTYTIGVNYYRGSAPETARIEVRAGGVSQIFTRNLPTALGSSGDNTPVIVTTVKVTRDAAGRNTYQIAQ